MFVAAAVCPHPPLLIPALGRGLGPEVEDLRGRCRGVVDGLLAADADVLFVVGADVGVHATSLAPWGVPVGVDVPEPLPLPLLIGAWLTRGRLRSFVAVAADMSSAECAEIGADLAGAAARVALLVMGDGSARHDVTAPGYVDDRAAAYDGTVHRALATADVNTLRALDPADADALLCAGRPGWQVLAGAARDTEVDVSEADLTVLFGVGYHVAAWTRRG